jgi:hypothetical protein
MTELPAAVRAMAARGPEWTAWVDDLPSVTQSHLEQWELRIDGEPTHGSGSIVLPVRTSDGAPAVLIAWVVVRVVREAIRELSNGAHANPTRLTKYVALAKAVQD